MSLIDIKKLQEQKKLLESIIKTKPKNEGQKRAIEEAKKLLKEIIEILKTI